jgi:2-dehydro-3-deoxyphosphogluconate aldolase/(4S)-4-hydroxy-2-oxoglutarate aldolase
VIKALHGPFPNMRFMPTGGIGLETMGEYLGFKPVLAVGGTWMLKKQWIDINRFDLVADACHASVDSALLARRGKHLAGREKATP